MRAIQIWIDDGGEEGGGSLKQSGLIVVALSLLFVVQGSVAQDRTFGLGVVIGEPTGISAKLCTSEYTAIDFGLGWSAEGDRIGNYSGYYSGGSRVHIHMDYLWHSFDVFQSTEQIPVYYGVGGRVNTGAGQERWLAVRGVFGVAWLPRGTPIDVFLEMAPTIQLTSPSGFGVDAGFGARYYF